jgi:hypothetical protein
VTRKGDEEITLAVSLLSQSGDSLADGSRRCLLPDQRLYLETAVVQCARQIVRVAFGAAESGESQIAFWPVDSNDESAFGHT